MMIFVDEWHHAVARYAWSKGNVVSENKSRFVTPVSNSRQHGASLHPPQIGAGRGGLFSSSAGKSAQAHAGVILFQEDVLKMARDLAVFTPGQGELLRRALGKKDATAALKQFEAQFVAGCLPNEVDMETAHTAFEKLLGFGSYSFPGVCGCRCAPLSTPSWRWHWTILVHRVASFSGTWASYNTSKVNPNSPLPMMISTCPISAGDGQYEQWLRQIEAQKMPYNSTSQHNRNVLL